MVKRAPARRRPRKAKAGSKGFSPAETVLQNLEGSAAEIQQLVEKAGGALVGQYKEPLGGHPALLAVLPIDAIEPTPFQRDLSDTHHKKLADVINKTGRFLDPIIAVTAASCGRRTAATAWRRCAVWVLNPSLRLSCQTPRSPGKSWH